MEKKLIIFAPYYLPGFKAGGPIKSISNIVNLLKKDLNIEVISRDRDISDTVAYKQSPRIDGYKVKYLSAEKYNVFHIYQLLKKNRNAVFYLNSFFDFKYSILIVVINSFVGREIIIAPRGEFSPGAIKIKYIKKKMFILMAKTSGVYNKVNWHASNKQEKKDIVNQFKSTGSIQIASNLLTYPTKVQKPLKNEGEARIFFLSRISVKKNLIGAIKSLNNCTGKVIFDIYGPIEDEKYWIECKQEIKKLPINIKVNYKNELSPDNIPDTIANYHCFLFPTYGENFGHVIFEALATGNLVITSDQTPWKDISEKEAGWICSLSQENKIAKAIQSLVDMNESTFNKASENAWEIAYKYANNSELKKSNENLFLSFFKNDT